MKGSLTPSVNEAVELKEILEKMKSLKGSMTLLVGLGDGCTSPVFYIPTSAVVSFFHTLCNEADSKANLQRRGVQLVFFLNQASLDVETGKTVFGSVVGIILADLKIQVVINELLHLERHIRLHELSQTFNKNYKKYCVSCMTRSLVMHETQSVAKFILLQK